MKDEKAHAVHVNQPIGSAALTGQENLDVARQIAWWESTRKTYLSGVV